MLAPSEKKEAPLALHQGIFRRQISLWQGVALIVSGTIGAGILGLPYAIAQVGVGLGILYILALGAIMMVLNLFLGELTIRTKEPLQLVGLAKLYLGPAGGAVMTLIAYSMIFGVLVIYIIGEGRSLSALFGGDSKTWSLGFFVLGALLICIGLRTIKTVELFLVGGIACVMLLIIFLSAPHISFEEISYINWKSFFIPYGVTLFALHGITAIPEAHSILVDRDKTFRKAIIYSSFIVVTLYILFSLTIVGVTGRETTDIATIGLGNAIGPLASVLGNIFAVLAMGTSFLMVGVSLRDSLMWDFHISKILARVLVCVVPFLIFIGGLTQFITAIEVVGGVLMSIELLLVVWICYRGLKNQRIFSLIGLFVLVFFLGAFLSILGLFS